MGVLDSASKRGMTWMWTWKGLEGSSTGFRVQARNDVDADVGWIDRWMFPGFRFRQGMVYYEKNAIKRLPRHDCTNKKNGGRPYDRHAMSS